MNPSLRRLVAGALFASAASMIAVQPGIAATPAQKAPRTVAKRPAPLAAAAPEQLAAAEQVYYGRHDCEFGQQIDVARSLQFAGYAQVKHRGTSYLMKPILSTTGAIRLEDVLGRTLVVQIAAKSMLMDVKAGRRIADECIGEQQRDFNRAEAAKAMVSPGAASAPPSAPASPAAVPDPAPSAQAASAPR